MYVFSNSDYRMFHANALKSATMVTDQTGAVIEDQNFYPWGQKWYDVGSHTGYRFFAGMKQQDWKTGNDPALHRDYNPGLGRWLTPDLLGGHLENPQTLNRYAYLGNNPLSYNDPSGMYTCRDSNDCSTAADKQFEKALDSLRGSKNAEIARAAGAYGAKNQDNGVTVGFKDLSTKGENGATVSTVGYDAAGKLRANSDVTINSKISGDNYTAAVGHEGSHVADAQDVVKSGLTVDGQAVHAGMNITPYQSEQRAYGVTNAILTMENQSRKYNCGTTACTLGVGSGMPALLPGVINQILAHNPDYNQGGRPMGPNNQGPSVVSGVTPSSPKLSVPH